MFDVRTIRAHIQLPFLLLLVIAFSIALAAQESASEKEKEKEEEAGKKTAAAGKLVNVKGSVRCEKRDPVYSIEVPDRPGHALILAQRKCTWTEPMEILGARSKDGVAVEFPEQMEGLQHAHGFEVDNYDNGEQVTWQSMGTVYGEKGPANCKGRWSLMRGTGKFKAIKGGGSYEGKLAADDVLVLEFEGVYDPSEMVGQKK